MLTPGRRDQSERAGEPANVVSSGAHLARIGPTASEKQGQGGGSVG